MKILLPFVFTFMSLVSYSQSQISGQILDGRTNQPIKAAKVIVMKNEIIATQTKKDGKFKLKGVNPLDTILFMSDGYSSAETVVGNGKIFKVVLFSERKEKDIDVGYGSQSAKSLTSSVTVLTANDFNKVLDVDIYSYLRGKVPGLHITQNASNPSDTPKIMLRGTGSLSGTYEPLIVIDGVQNASLQNLDPNDVASVTVLKDGSSQAIYGSQASGGVIIIKTKR